MATRPRCFRHAGALQAHDGCPVSPALDDSPDLRTSLICKCPCFFLPLLSRRFFCLPFQWTLRVLLQPKHPIRSRFAPSIYYTLPQVGRWPAARPCSPGLALFAMAATYALLTLCCSHGALEERATGVPAPVRTLTDPSHHAIAPSIRCV